MAEESSASDDGSGWIWEAVKDAVSEGEADEVRKGRRGGRGDAVVVVEVEVEEDGRTEERERRRETAVRAREEDWETRRETRREKDWATRREGEGEGEGARRRTEAEWR